MTPTSLARLVWGKVEQVAAELLALTTAAAWEELLEDIPAQYVSPVESLIASLTLTYLADFDRRVLSPLRSYPHSLLWFAKGDPSTPDIDRQTRALALLSEDASKLHITALKLRTLFFDELQACAATGVVPMQLYTTLFVVACVWRCDVQDMEGVNNIL